MKLFYCQIPGGNVGNRLNVFLWLRLLSIAKRPTRAEIGMVLARLLAEVRLA